MTGSKYSVVGAGTFPPSELNLQKPAPIRATKTSPHAAIFICIDERVRHRGGRYYLSPYDKDTVKGAQGGAVRVHKVEGRGFHEGLQVGSI